MATYAYIAYICFATKRQQIHLNSRAHTQKKKGTKIVYLVLKSGKPIPPGPAPGTKWSDVKAYDNITALLKCALKSIMDPPDGLKMAFHL